MTVYKDANSGKVAREELTIRLPERRFAADIIANRSLGQGETIGASITSGGALVIGLNRNADSLNLDGPVKARLGDHLSFMIRSAIRRKLLLRCHFFAPDGSFLHVYARSVLMDGVTGTVTFPSALNDPPGRYRLVVTDLISAAAAESTFALEP